MEALSVIVGALVSGAAVALKETAATAVKDAYAALRALVRSKFGTVDVAVVEADPASKARRAVLEEELGKARAGEDAELLAKAVELLELLRTHAPDAGAAVGVDLSDLTAAGSLRLRDISASGTGVKVERTWVGGDVEITGVRAGVKDSDPN